MQPPKIIHQELRRIKSTKDLNNNTKIVLPEERAAQGTVSEPHIRKQTEDHAFQAKAHHTTKNIHPLFY